MFRVELENFAVVLMKKRKMMQQMIGPILLVCACIPADWILKMNLWNVSRHLSSC